MDQNIPVAVQVVALKQLLSYMIFVLTDEQKEALQKLMDKAPVAIEGEDCETEEQKKMLFAMQAYIKDIVKVGCSR